MRRGLRGVQCIKDMPTLVAADTSALSTRAVSQLQRQGKAAAAAAASAHPQVWVRRSSFDKQSASTLHQTGAQRSLLRDFDGVASGVMSWDLRLLGVVGRLPCCSPRGDSAGESVLGVTPAESHCGDAASTQRVRGARLHKGTPNAIPCWQEVEPVDEKA